jgi:hypothetical protein
LGLIVVEAFVSNAEPGGRRGEHRYTAERQMMIGVHRRRTPRNFVVLFPIRFNDSAIQRFNVGEAIRVHSRPFVVNIRRWLRLTIGE